MKNEKHPVCNYHDVLLLSLCTNRNEQCFFRECPVCTKSKVFEEMLEEIFRKHEIQNINHKQWVSTPRAALETVQVSSTEFVHNFCKLREAYLKHSFIATEQANCYKSIKKNLQSDQCIVICDFAENYAFVIQNAVPGFHWNNNQATIFPIVFYYNDNGLIKHETLVFISDCTKHDAVAVYVYLQAFNEYLSDHHPHILQCIYFSDGAPQQFKNVKHFSTIYYHQQDFGRSAVWHFHATAHGKGPCDGAGGALKRKARKASLQMTSETQISTALQLYDWAVQDECFANINVMYKNKDDYKKAAEDLADRFGNCATIKGTQKFHYVEPADDQKLAVKRYSLSQKTKIVSFIAKRITKPALKRKLSSVVEGIC